VNEVAQVLELRRAAGQVDRGLHPAAELGFLRHEATRVVPREEIAQVVGGDERGGARIGEPAGVCANRGAIAVDREEGGRSVRVLINGWKVHAEDAARIHQRLTQQRVLRRIHAVRLGVPLRSRGATISLEQRREDVVDHGRDSWVGSGVHHVSGTQLGRERDLRMRRRLGAPRVVKRLLGVLRCAERHEGLARRPGAVGEARLDVCPAQLPVTIGIAQVRGDVCPALGDRLGARLGSLFLQAPALVRASSVDVSVIELEADRAPRRGDLGGRHVPRQRQDEGALRELLGPTTLGLGDGEIDARLGGAGVEDPAGLGQALRGQLPLGALQPQRSASRRRLRAGMLLDVREDLVRDSGDLRGRPADARFAGRCGCVVLAILLFFVLVILVEEHVGRRLMRFGRGSLFVLIVELR
jgi:hypothetical protein